MLMQTQWIFKPLTLALAACMLLITACSKSDTTVPDENNPPPPSTLTEKIIIDTAYGTDARQKMDIYLPAGRTGDTKVVLLIHGGAWVGGDKSENNGFLAELKSKWPEAAFVNINYRLANGTTITYNQMIDDIHAAVSFVTGNKNKFQVSDVLALGGASAGAHLALQYTYTKNSSGHVKCVADLFGPAIIADWDWYTKTVPLNAKDILTKMSGSAWNEELYKKLSPYYTASATSKPTIIFHGNLDPLVPVYQSQWFYGRLKELGVPVEYYEYTDFHGFTFTANSTDCVNRTIAFFKKHMK